MGIRWKSSFIYLINNISALDIFKVFGDVEKKKVPKVKFDGTSSISDPIPPEFVAHAETCMNWIIV